MVSDSMLVVLASACLVLGNASVDGRRLEAANNFESVKRKGTVKSIESFFSATGDVIDCVEIYKQPAFDHPLLQNHIIEMAPNSSPRGVKQRNNQAKLIQDWLKDGECPEGTIPIIRPQRAPIKLQKSFGDVTNSIHEYAQVSLPSGTYYLNVWKPTTYGRDISLAQTWVMSGACEELNTIEAGWMVRSNWWLQLEGEYVGYWPGSIFTRLADHATRIDWGGEISTDLPHGRHTQTQMGSGHFSHEGLGRVSFFTQLQYEDQSRYFKHATSLIPYTTNEGCYDITVEGTSPATFFYGGPGYSESCPRG